jgi:hypothetical protein
MKIKNETRWRTDQLRRIIIRIAREELSPEKRKALVIRIAYRGKRSPTGWTTGNAYVGGWYMTIFLNAHIVNRPDFALTVAHEMAHIRGLHHKQMNGRRSYDHRVAGAYEMYAWANEYPVELCEKNRRVVEDVQAKRYALVMNRVEAWTKKLKRAQTALETLAKKQKYYELALAAKNK